MNAERADFEEWLQRVHLLDATWNEERNCYDEFPAHLAFKAWQESQKKLLSQLSDPSVVHVAMLRGEIATPPLRSLLHIYGEEAIAQFDRGA